MTNFPISLSPGGADPAPQPPIELPGDPATPGSALDGNVPSGQAALNAYQLALLGTTETPPFVGTLGEWLLSLRGADANDFINTDPRLAGNSDEVSPSQKATRTFVEGRVLALSDAVEEMVSDESAARQSADAAATARLASLESATASLATLPSDLVAESEARVSADDDISAEIQAEVSRATGVEAGLQAAVDSLVSLMASDDTTLDQLQEIVEFIKINRDDLDSLGIASISGLSAALLALEQSIAAVDSDLASSVAALSATISTNKSSAETALAAEVTRATAAEAALTTLVNGKQPASSVLTNTTASFTTEKDSKLAGVSPGATANSSDAFLLARSNHTGMQPQDTVTNLVSDLAAKAPKDSPSLTGTPVAPTPATSDDSTKIATTAHVQAVVRALVGLAPAELNTLAEIAAALAANQTSDAALAAAVSGKLSKTANLSDLSDVGAARIALGVQNFSGTSSGVNTGDQDLSGLVPKSTTINGVALSGNITITFDAGSLAGNTLAANVTNSNLKRFGTHIELGTPASGDLSNTVNIPAAGLIGDIPLQRMREAVAFAVAMA
jgi:hypothetical protein